jgi:SAM-dependent methyltransferase
MDPQAAGVEILRILRPGGHVGLVWNILDTRHAWVADLDRLTRDHEEAARASTATGEATPEVPTSFGAAQDRSFDNPQTLSPADLIDLVTTWSWVATHPERDDVIRKVAALIERVAGPGSIVTLPQVCRCFRYQIG